MFYPALMFVSQFENGKKMLILHGTRTSAVLKFMMEDLFHLMSDHYVKYANNMDNIKLFESRGPTSLEIFSHKSYCNLLFTFPFV